MTCNEVESLVDFFAEVTVTCGTDVVSQGETADFMYVVESGYLSVNIETDGVISKKRTDLGPSYFFGELAILYDCPRGATVTALSDCVLWQIHRSHLDLTSDVRISVHL